MLNEPRTYRHPPFQMVMGIVLLAFIIFGAFLALDSNTVLILLPFIFLAALAGIYVLYLFTSKTIIADTEISSQTILGTKSLAWNQISRVSGKHYRIKLHNFDGDMTVSPSPQLPGYDEVIEWIGEKRPDLFNPLEYRVMTRNLLTMVGMVILIFLIVGIAALSVIDSGQWFMSIFMVIIGLIIAGIILSSPQSITIAGKSLRIKYLFSEKSLQADEIESVQWMNQRSRNGRNYFIVLNLRDQKTVRIASIDPSLPIAYLVLKNWHKKNSLGQP